MKELVENGFTVFLAKHDDRLVGTALRSLENGRGMEPVYIEQENLKKIDDFSFSDLLEDGKTLQMYKSNYGGRIYPCYIAQIGSIRGEGPYGEEDCFSIVAEGASSEFYEALMSLEEQCRKLEDCSHKLPIKKAYRFYGDTRYEVHKK